MIKSTGFTLLFYIILLALPTAQPGADDSRRKIFSELTLILQQQPNPLEQTLFKDATNHQFKTLSIAQEGLIASGVKSWTEFNKLSLKLSSLEERAQQLFSGYSPSEKAKKLLIWLHEHVLTTYTEKQSLLQVALKNGLYNCVSVTVLYNGIGSSLQLPLKAVSTEKHVFSLLPSSAQNFDIETTTQYGFNPSLAAVQELEKKTGFVRVGQEEVSARREIENVELIALIYFNRALTSIAEKDYEQGLLLFAKALLLDPSLKQARSSLNSLLSMYSAELLNQQKYKVALALIELGLQLSPDNQAMKHNITAGWHNYALLAAKTRPATEAIGVIRTAYDLLETEALRALQAQIFVTEALAFSSKDQWEDGYKVLLKAQPLISANSYSSLKQWTEHYLLKWSINEIKNKSYDLAFEVIYALLSLNANKRIAIDNLAYITQEWSRQIARTQSIEAATDKINTIVRQYGQHKKIKKVASQYTIWAVKRLLKEQQFAQALAMTNAAKAVLKQPQLIQMLTVVFDQWSQAYIKQQNWGKAVKTYQLGLQQLPNNHTLIENEKYTWNEWGRAFIKEKKIKIATQIFNKALKRYPNDEILKTNLRYCQQFQH